MEIEFGKNKIIFEKELNALDMLAIDFCNVLNKLKVNYVIISGYEAVLFGRNRSSEDIDLFTKQVGKEKFQEIWSALQQSGFWCLNADFDEAFDLLENSMAPRFARKDEAVPNIEVKFAKEDLDIYSLENGIKVLLNGSEIYIGPFELNIAFKLFLGSDKDIEDAKFLYDLFADKLDQKKLKFFISQLKVEEKAKFLWKTTKN